jgi:cation:H+ antiporter
MAIGNVVGSNTANILMVLGLPAVLFGLDAAETDLRKNYALMIGGSLLFIYLASLGVFSYGSGARCSAAGLENNRVDLHWFGGIAIWRKSFGE